MCRTVSASPSDSFVGRFHSYSRPRVSYIHSLVRSRIEVSRSPYLPFRGARLKTGQIENECLSDAFVGPASRRREFPCFFPNRGGDKGPSSVAPSPRRTLERVPAFGVRAERLVQSVRGSSVSA